MERVLWTLRSVGALAWRQNAGTVVVHPEGARRRIIRVGFKGLSDVFAVLPGGRAVAVEVKATGRLTAHQQAFLRAVSSLGGLAFVVRNHEDVDELAAQLRELVSQKANAEPYPQELPGGEGDPAESRLFNSGP